MSAAAPPAAGGRVVVCIAPLRDARRICSTLEPLGVRCQACDTAEALLRHAEAGAEVFVVGAETLTPEIADELIAANRPHPRWSDIPVLLCTPPSEQEAARQETAGRARALAERLGAAFDVVVLQRPLAPSTLVSAVRLALRDRQRQYEVRDLLAQLDASTLALEDQVGERTRQLRGEAQARERLTREVLDVATREQRRIAQDIHDSLGSHLTGIALLSHGLADDVRQGRPVDPSMLERLGDLADDGIDKARALARGISPAPLGAGGLAGGLAELADTVTRGTGILCRFRQETAVPALDDEAETHLYRIAQEATQNAVKHAGASSISILFGCPHPEAVRVTVEDDGGWIAEPLPAPAMGVGTMRYRSGLIGGRLSIVRAPGGGTRVACELPLAPSS